MISVSFYRFTQNLRIILPSLLHELIARLILFIGLLVLHHNLSQGQARCITEAELLTEYKKPRRDSLISPMAMVLSIIIIPFLIFCTPLMMANYSCTLHALLGWTLALLLNGIITEVLKITIRRPRPDFFYRCYPTGVTDYCTGNDRDVIEGRKSFPSGHSSFAFSSLGFLTLWMNEMFSTSDRASISVQLFCLLPITLAGIIGVSRYFDNHHHWWDIIVGGAIGIVCCYVCYNAYCNRNNHTA